MAKFLADLVSWHRKQHARRGKRRREALFRKRYIADVPVDLEAMPQYRGEFFPESGPKPWIDRPDALAVLDQKVASKAIAPDQAEICRGLIVDGYYIAKNLIPTDVLDTVWQSYEQALENKLVSVKPEIHGEGDRFPGRLLDPHLKIPEVASLLWHPELIRITDLLFGRRTIPFQTIIGHKSSQQLPHSDAIHMTTYPLGFLAAAWVAFEDVHPDSGPLVYYPKSHRLLPYLLSADVGIGMMEFKERTSIYNEQYEKRVKAHLDTLGLSPLEFCGKKGDVLLWHANLVHAGSRRKDLRRSRKALVCHYFAEGAFTYHDLSGNASRLHRNGPYAEVIDDRPVATPGPAARIRREPPMEPVDAASPSDEGAGRLVDVNETTTAKEAAMARAKTRTPEMTDSLNPHLGRSETLPGVIYEGPTRMLYRVWARGDSDASLRVEADGIVRTIIPNNSIDVVGTKISIAAKRGSPVCEYQFIARDQ